MQLRFWLRSTALADADGIALDLQQAVSMPPHLTAHLMVVGDAQVWADRFVTFDERFLERIAAVWPACMAALEPQPEEDDITINLIDRSTA